MIWEITRVKRRKKKYIYLQIKRLSHNVVTKQTFYMLTIK